jgi:hypothetical protein
MSINPDSYDDHSRNLKCLPASNFKGRRFGLLVSSSDTFGSTIDDSGNRVQREGTESELLVDEDQGQRSAESLLFLVRLVLALSAHVSCYIFWDFIFDVWSHPRYSRKWQSRISPCFAIIPLAGSYTNENARSLSFRTFFGSH